MTDALLYFIRIAVIILYLYDRRRIPESSIFRNVSDKGFIIGGMRGLLKKKID
jgi:hypothetical protein